MVLLADWHGYTAINLLYTNIWYCQHLCRTKIWIFKSLVLHFTLQLWDTEAKELGVTNWCLWNNMPLQNRGVLLAKHSAYWLITPWDASRSITCIVCQCHFWLYGCMPCLPEVEHVDQLFLYRISLTGRRHWDIQSSHGWSKSIESVVRYLEWGGGHVEIYPEEPLGLMSEVSWCMLYVIDILIVM